MGFQYISVSVYIESSSEAVVSRLTDCPKIVLNDSKKSNKRFVCSLLLPPAKFATVWIQMIVRRFAEPDLGQTRMSDLFASAGYTHNLKVKKISDKYHKSTFSSRCTQCAVSFMCQPAQLKLNCLLSYFGT